MAPTRCSKAETRDFGLASFNTVETPLAEMTLGDLDRGTPVVASPGFAGYLPKCPCPQQYLWLWSSRRSPSSYEKRFVHSTPGPSK